MATIEDRGDFQFRARIRRKGVSRSKTFESYKEAEEWALWMEGKVVGNELADDREARETTLQDALEWYMDRIAPIDPRTGKRRCRSQNVKNKVSAANYWITPARWQAAVGGYGKDTGYNCHHFVETGLVNGEMEPISRFRLDTGWRHSCQ